EFSQATRNILDNAIHAIKNAIDGAADRKGTITVSTRRDGAWFELRISDTGTGIPPDIQPTVFAPFFTTKEVGTGMGLGLAIVHAIIVRKHGGTVTFESELGKGTTFIIRLPIDPEPAEEPATECHEEAHFIR
ncbi:MAG: HAMP domain-containing histidine kinase, partial [Planctomycetes bacterium]|nr:HAMP domain-containing histidine kinase [Planctomycetota bacterium]